MQRWYWPWAETMPWPWFIFWMIATFWFVLGIIFGVGIPAINAYERWRADAREAEQRARYGRTLSPKVPGGPAEHRCENARHHMVIAPGLSCAQWEQARRGHPL